jgi:hypothetical protein
MRGPAIKPVLRPAGFVTVSVPLDEEGWGWIRARASKRGSTPEVEAGRLLQAHLRSRARSDERERKRTRGIG